MHIRGKVRAAVHLAWEEQTKAKADVREAAAVTGLEVTNTF